MNFSLKVSVEGDNSREMSFKLEPLEAAVENGTWDKQHQNGIGVDPNSGHWTYVDYSGELWLSENTDVFCAVRVASDWSNSLIGGTTIMGQGYMLRTTEGDVNVLYSMEPVS